ncbi:FO synthase subunit 2 [Desulfamplus magnetovallimortis]|uniref:Cyclic dehypoxanthine futalosine synthase n=1 Tax=Desulfamplus magnetovallimortis TaxID=1246637 RepID=A0A1W1HCM5_9BACT|nr:cyclic dehypoxanthinyl futalosine synthase [Desulfamplus magnetovallimortis]SLM30138.1 FO synthase subunit 2 [Desulfamplus magnetovallimortis]
MQNIDTVIEKISRGERIDSNEGLALYHGAELQKLSALANHKRFRLNPDRIITYVIDRNINYTDICMSGCRFCAFYKKPDSGDGYVIPRESLHHKIRETIDLGGTQILLQGGMNPNLDFSYYLDLLRDIKENFRIHIHGFSPPEIAHMAKISSMSIRSVITELKKAGLDSIPGGGAEILCDDIRKKVSPNKCMADTWLEVMETAHELGLKSSATMMFGHLESPEHIFEHLEKIRSLQERTGGFTAFIPWTFQPTNTKINRKKTGAVEYLRVLALSRLYLDNVRNIQASWVTQGDKIAQLALFYGANDMGSTMIEENVVASAGVNFMLPEKELRRLIKKAGFEPRQRDCYYNLL